MPAYTSDIDNIYFFPVRLLCYLPDTDAELFRQLPAYNKASEFMDISRLSLEVTIYRFSSGGAAFLHDRPAFHILILLIFTARNNYT
ncbi:hypothetical protein [Chitinophaga sp.]|uniref:hypothetical protein n=1 Tax=Chitinophaga sp. TaxID=1869181 RepID=UPI002F923E2C